MEPFNRLQLHIPGPVPSKKNSKSIFRANNNRTYVVSSKFYRNWETEQLYRLNTNRAVKAHKSKLPISNCTMRLTFVPWDKRKWDLTNKAESIMDLLVKAGILKDDNYSVISKLILDLRINDITFQDSGCYIFIDDIN